MFSFFKKKKESFIKEIAVDMHSHLLPGIDDGAKSKEDSLALIKKMQDLSYHKLIVTPHIMQDSYPNTKEIIYKTLETLKLFLEENSIDIKIEAAAEHYLDEAFLENLETDRVLPLAKEYLLFETSYIARPLNLEDLIYEISVKGYKPIFAHPERYRYIKDLESEYKALKDLGVYFQVNLNSLNGYYGKEAQKKALFLLENGLIDFLGSDTHHQRHLENLEKIAFDKDIWNKINARNKILNKTLLEG